jgi:signal transduction histidine kinase/CheY-like chemotaxis protein
MKQWLRTQGGWWLAWLALTAVGAAWIARAELAQMHQDFETDVRIAHRLLSQQMVQYDAVLATLALLEPSNGADHPEQRLPSVYSSILRVQRRDRDEPWPDNPRMGTTAQALAAAEARSREQHRAELATLDLAHGRYVLVMGATPFSYALDIDLAGSVPWRDWPMNPQRSPVRLSLQRDGQELVLQPGVPAANGWRFGLTKALASPSQPFDVVAERQVGWGELPWRGIGGWAAAMAALMFGLWAAQRQRVARRRAEELLRLGQVARLNALGELSAGLAHELNQPLTAVLANAQAARRLLDDEPPDLATARDAMGQAVEQARRAAGWSGACAASSSAPKPAATLKPLVLQDVVRSAMHLLAPEFAKHAVPRSSTHRAGARARAGRGGGAGADRAQPADERGAGAGAGASGRAPPGRLGRAQRPGGPADGDRQRPRHRAGRLLPRMFEPFFSTREHGLGLGLSLCETLASGMGGSLRRGQRAAARRAFPCCCRWWPGPMNSDPAQSPLVHLVDDDQAVRDALALLIGTMGLRVQHLGRPAGLPATASTARASAPSCWTCACPASAACTVLDRLVAQGVDQPVIMLTGHGTVEMCRRAFKAGAAEFLEKPVDDEQLLEALQHAVRQHVRSRERSAG